MSCHQIRMPLTYVLSLFASRNISIPHLNSLQAKPFPHPVLLSRSRQAVGAFFWARASTAEYSVVLPHRILKSHFSYLVIFVRSMKRGRTSRREGVARGKQSEKARKRRKKGLGEGTESDVEAYFSFFFNVDKKHTYSAAPSVTVQLLYLTKRIMQKRFYLQSGEAE